jgi:long-chain acyl-CoA synthetase
LNKQKTQAHLYPWLKNYPEAVNWHAEIPAKPLYALIDEATEKYPNAMCIDFLDKKYSYHDTNKMINHFAKYLQDNGAKKGTRIGLLLPNTPYFIFAYFAILKIGGIVVNFNPLYAKRELVHQQEDSNTEILITLDLKIMMEKAEPLLYETDLKKVVICSMQDILPFWKKILFSIFGFHKKAKIPDNENFLFFNDCLKNAGDFTPTQINPDEDIAVLQYTGGTTGIPKGAMLTHANLIANTEQTALWFHKIRDGEDKMLGVIPLFHVFAMTAVMNLSIRFGMEIYLLPRFELNQVLKTLTKARINFFPAVPTIYTAILNEKSLKSYDLSSIKMCISGGAPLPMDVKTEFEALTGCSLVEGYGLSETSPVATINPLSGTPRSGSIGLPIPQTIIEIIDKNDRTTILPIGEKGEICISGPQVMAGYWRNPSETKMALKNGRFHTGDIGYMDEDGYIYIIDRIKDMILAGGYNIYPRNVEEAIYLHPSVKECIVAGVPDKYRGQTVKAYIVIKEDHYLEKGQLMSFLKDKLSPIETPKIIEFRDELPKTMIGKLSRKDVLAEEANAE